MEQSIGGSLTLKLTLTLTCNHHETCIGIERTWHGLGYCLSLHLAIGVCNSIQTQWISDARHGCSTTGSLYTNSFVFLPSFQVEDFCGTYLAGTSVLPCWALYCRSNRNMDSHGTDFRKHHANPMDSKRKIRLLDICCFECIFLCWYTQFAS